MKIEALEKAVELNGRLRFVQGAIVSINDGTVIQIGSRLRMDRYMDVQLRLKRVVEHELLEIIKEIEIEIKQL